MSSLSFQTVSIAIAQIFVLCSVGFFLVRRKIVDDSGLKLLSWLSVNISFPFYIFYQIIHNFNPSTQSHWWAYPLINLSLCLTGVLIASGAALLFKKKESHEWAAIGGFHNAGYIPLLLVTMLPLADKTQELYSYVILTIIGFDLCLWSLGAWLLSDRKKAKVSLKSFINPPILSMMAAFILVLLGAKNIFPETVLKPIRVMGDSALAIAMLTIGGNLALTHFKKIQWKNITGAVLIKLFILPVLALIFLRVTHMGGMWAFILMVQSCMPTSITLSIIARHNDNPHQNLINQTIFVTHVLCALTIPLFLGLYGGGY
ncbi:MAG: AEC family transporter [Candidatus Omnitrophica bacterium]|nr:AEC family transporter [Candidatus Omnitrophota bacterium]